MQYDVEIPANDPWHRTGINLVAGRPYAFVVPAGQTWKDWFIDCGAAGWTSPLQCPLRPFLRLRKVRGERVNFFTLIGTVGKSYQFAFRIGMGLPVFVPETSGELYCFANDAPFAYGNNKGCMKLSVIALDD